MQITKENLTIIIVTIKSQKIIDGCLKSIDPDIKKIIVENSSNHEFTNYLKEKYKNIECYLTGKNLGMGSGNNFGIEKSKTRYVMILNPDTILKPNTLNQIFEISKNLEFAILSPLSDNKDYPNYKVQKELTNKKKGLFEVDQIDGYAMILDKHQFNDNFFDEKIFMYLENDDLCLRVKKNKKKIYIFHNAEKASLNADVIFTDKVVSLNDKVNKKQKLLRFNKFKVTKKLMSYTNKDCIFLHCLPRGPEVEEKVFFSKQSKVWQQALNRVHVQKSILLYCFGKLR